MKTIEVSTSIELTRIADLLCCAFDPVSRNSAVGYWCDVVGYQAPSRYDIRTDVAMIYPYMDNPINIGGAILLEIQADEDDEENGKALTLDLVSIEKGAQIMATKYPKHWADFLDENEDITTADVFVQCCVLGDVVYG